MRLALQTYTVRGDAKADLAATLFRIRALGLSAVELARIPFTQNNALVVAKSGLEVVSLQVKPKILEKKSNNILQFCRMTNCRLLVVSVMPWSAILGKERAIDRFAGRLNRMAEVYGKAGISLAFHHHDFEFASVRSGLKFDVLLARTAPNVGFIVDTYWVKTTGRDPLEWIRHLGGRVIGLHLRDCQSPQGKKRPGDCEIGRGTIDFPTLLASLPEHIRYGAIEQNSPEPWKSLEISLDALRSMNQKNRNY